MIVFLDLLSRYYDALLLDLASNCEQWGEELGLVSLLKTWHTASLKQLEHDQSMLLQM